MYTVSKWLNNTEYDLRHTDLCSYFSGDCDITAESKYVSTFELLYYKVAQNQSKGYNSLVHMYVHTCVPVSLCVWCMHDECPHPGVMFSVFLNQSSSDFLRWWFLNEFQIHQFG